MKIASTFLLLFLCTLHAKDITIAVAANASFVIEELKKEFKKEHPNTEVKVRLASSGKLLAQILHGAPYSLYMSANMKYPQALYNKGYSVNKPIVYAQGSLAFLSANNQDFSKGIELLKDKKIEKISIANPKTAPYGVATLEAFKRAGIYADVESKLVYAESISQSVSYTLSATDIGIIATSSLYSPHMKKFTEGVHWMKIDSALYTPINQGVVLLKEAQNNSEAKAFYNFIQSDKAKTIFKSLGYITP